MKDITGTVRVIAKPNPFKDETLLATVGSNVSLREILGNDGNNYIINLNGENIPCEDWSLTFVHDDDLVLIARLPKGGDDNSILRLFAAIVVLIVAYWAAPFLDAAFIGGEAFWASAVMFVGFVGIGLLLPPTLDTDTQPEAKRNNSLTGTRNQFLPFGIIPNLYGRHRLYPPIASIPTTEVIGADQYLNMLFCVGIGDYDIDDATVKIGDTLATDFEDIDISYTDQPTQLDIFELQQSLNLTQATEPGDTFTRNTAADTTSISMDFVLPAGLMAVDDDDGDKHWFEIHISVEYRIAASSDPWVFLNAANGNFGLETHGSLLIGVIPATGYPPPLTSSSVSITISDQNANWLKISGMTRDAGRVGIRWAPGAADSWEVRVTRQMTKRPGIASWTESSAEWDSVVASLVWTTLRSLKTSPAVTLPAGIATFIQLRVRATDQLRGVIDSLNIIATRKLRSWDKVGQQFVAAAATRSPAWAFLDILTGLGNARPIASGDEANKIVLDDLADWHAQTVTDVLYYDHVIDFNTSVFNALVLAAGVGRAAISNRDGKWTVILEQAGGTYVQYFSARNSWGFSSTKRFVEYPHAFRVRFNSEDSDYQEDEMVVYDDGYTSGNATDFEVLQLVGITDSDQAWKTARYTMASIQLRPEVYTFNADVEHIVAQRGDHILFAHDIPLWGVTQGRITNIAGNVITLDESSVLDGGTNYVIRVRLDDGTSVVEDLTLQAGSDIFSHTFTPSIPAGINIGDLAILGEVNSEGQELVVISIEPSQNLTALITAMDHNDAILTADSGPIPPWDPGITLPVDPTQIRPAPPFNITASSDQFSFPTDGNNVIQPRILVTWDLPTNATTEFPALSADIRYRGYDIAIGSEGLWTYVHIPNAFSGNGTIQQVDIGVEYEIQVRVVTQYDEPSFWSSAILHTVGGATRLPPGVDSLAVTGISGGVIADVDITSVDIRTGAYIEIAYGTVNDRDDVGTVLTQFAIPSDISTLTVLDFFISFTDTTTRYFWAKLVDIYSQVSIWEPSSPTAGISATPLDTSGLQYYIKPTNGTAIKNGVGTLTVEAHIITGQTDLILSSGTIQLYDPSNNIVNVANGYVAGSDGYTGILDSGDITNEIVITLKDGVGGTPLDTITLVDIIDGTNGLNGVYAYIEPRNTLAWVQLPGPGIWNPTDTSTSLDVTMVQGGAEVARWSRIVNRASDGTLSDGGVDTHPGGNLNTTRITPSVTIAGKAATVAFAYSFSGDAVTIAETVTASNGAEDPSFYYIKPTDGTAIKNGTGTLTVEAHWVVGFADVLLSTGTIQLFDPSNQIVNVANGYQTGSDGYTGVLDSTNITGDIVLTLKDGVGGAALDTITLVDVLDGLSGVYGYIEPENGLAWRRDGTDGNWTPSQLTTDFDCTFVQGGVDVARQGYRITLNQVDGTFTGATTPHPLTDLNISRITITPSTSGLETMTVKFDYSFSGDVGSVSETAISAQGGGTGTPGTVLSLNYDDLDTTTLAAGKSRYAMLTARATNTSGSQNNFQSTDAILINKADINGTIYGLYFKNIEVFDRVTYWISSTRWYTYVIDETFDTVGTGSAEAYKFGVTLDQSLDADPTVNIPTAAGTDVEFRFNQVLGLPDNLLLDPDFDLSNSLPVVGTTASAGFWDNTTPWVGLKNFTSSSTTPTILNWGLTFNSGTGPNGSNTITLKPAIPVGGPGFTEGWLVARRRIRVNAPAFTVKMRIAVTEVATTDSLLRVQMRGYDAPTSPTAQATVEVGFGLPYTDGSTYADYEFLLEADSDVDAQYWEFRLGFNHVGVQDIGEVEIDSIFLSPTPRTFGTSIYVPSTGNSQVTPGLVPKSDTVVNSGQYLKADGTWDDPVGGSASNSFSTQTVTDTDSGFSWAATGSALADSATDTLTWVSGTGIDIDVDATSDAIRITSSNTGVADGTATDSSLRWSGTAWVENTNIEMDASSIKITNNSNADIHLKTVFATLDEKETLIRQSASGGITIQAIQDSGFLGAVLFNVSRTGNSWDAMRLRPPLLMEERAAAAGSFATYGQIWIKNDNPNTIWFTNDVGTDVQLGTGGNVGNTGTPLNNQIAIWTDATTIEGVTNLTYDGTDFDVNANLFIGGDVTGHFETVSGIEGSVQADGKDGSTGFFAGYAVGNRSGFFDTVGTLTTNEIVIHDQLNGNYVLRYNGNQSSHHVALYDDGSLKLQTLATGILAIGDVGASTFSGVALTTGGVATNFLNETGAYSVPAGGSGTVGGTGTDNFLAVWNGTANIDAGGSFLVTNAVDKTAAETISGVWTHTGSFKFSDGTDSLAFLATAGVVTAQPTGGLTSIDFNLAVSANSLSASGTVTGVNVTTGADPGHTHTAYLTSAGTPLNNQLAVWTDSNTLEGDANITWDGTFLALPDNKRLRLGAGADADIWFDATDLNISTIGTADIIFSTASTDFSLWMEANAGVHIYYNNSEKLLTTNTGVTVTGTMAATTVTGANVTTGSNPGHTHTGTSISALDAGDTTTGTFNTARIPLATATAKGGVELFSNTDNPTAANSVTSTAARTYGIQLNAANQAVVNVPWTDTAGGSFLPLAGGTLTGNVIHDHSGSVSNVYDVGSTSFDVDMQYKIAGTLHALVRWDSSLNQMSWQDRSPSAVTQMTLALNTGALDVTGACTAASFAGINSTNLVDRTTGATISGAWSFSGANTVTGGSLRFNDSIDAVFGTTSDVAVRFNGATTFDIQMISGVNFLLRGGTSGASPMIAADSNAAVGLYHAGQPELFTQQRTATGQTTGARVYAHSGSFYDVGLNVLPQFNFNASDTLEAQHCGHATGKSNTTTTYKLTGPTSSNVDFPVNGVAHVYNLGASGNYTLEDTGTCTMYFCDGTAAPVDIALNGTLAPGGMITLWRFSTTAIYITGSGFTP